MTVRIDAKEIAVAIREYLERRNISVKADSSVWLLRPDNGVHMTEVCAEVRNIEQPMKEGPHR